MANSIDAAIDAVRPSRNGAASVVESPEFLAAKRGVLESWSGQLPSARSSVKPLKVYVGNIYGRDIEPMHWMSVDALRSATSQRENGVQVMFRPTWNDALLCRARAKTATAFLLDSDADVHVSIDGDIVFEPWQVAQIARQAVEYGMVGGMYTTRSREDARPTSIFAPGQRITFGSDPTPQPVRWLASGFVATHRRVMEAVAKTMPLCHPDREWRFYPMYQPYVVDGPQGTPIYLSEDFAFCQRVIDAGFAPHIAPNIRIYHQGLYPHRLEDCLQKPLEEREITVTYQEDGRFKFEA